ncbi:AzlD domain-containing protein [Halobacteria archaeon AArc-m2/3/4]|uniref:AzlD domain-containing protein n=1 Tax=Natronoglomus mannanivorans TaxID=2979990 RepID=A0AAP2Z3A4_9EURY|nr:AzlD domain-containing protein [Halobacteria archaeon AArc-xg1-1]MCU4975231.1 AzlD domain-containing protein [Halobacteria archaeon AArc-m2/3/4]
MTSSVPIVAPGPRLAFTPELTLDPFVVAVIAAMVVLTYATKVGGLWVLRRLEVSERVESGLSVLPGAIVIAFLGPELVTAGPAEWGAAALVLLVAWRTESIVLALACGMGAVVLLRTVV